MKPLLRSEHRELAGRAAALPPAPVCLPALVAVVDAWICAGRALLLVLDRGESYERPGHWHDPLSGRTEPFDLALARAMHDAAGGQHEPFARLVVTVEEQLLRAACCSPMSTEHGVVWRDRFGAERGTRVDAVAVVAGRVLASVRGPEAPAGGPSVVRERGDQRDEREGDDVVQPPAPDDVAQAPAPDDVVQAPTPEEVAQPPVPDDVAHAPAPDEDDAPLAPWMERAIGMEGTLQREGLRAFAYEGFFDVHAPGVAGDGGDGVCR